MKIFKEILDTITGEKAKRKAGEREILARYHQKKCERRAKRYMKKMKDSGAKMFMGSDGREYYLKKSTNEKICYTYMDDYMLEYNVLKDDGTIEEMVAEFD